MKAKDFEELKESVKEGGKMLSKSQRKRIAIQKKGQKIDDDRLEELIRTPYFYREDYFHMRIALKELQSLQMEYEKQHNNYNEEVTQFNEGLEAYESGNYEVIKYSDTNRVDIISPHYENDHDTWEMGFAWAQHTSGDIDKLKEQNKALIKDAKRLAGWIAEFKRLRGSADLYRIDGSGCLSEDLEQHKELIEKTND